MNEKRLVPNTVYITLIGICALTVFFPIEVFAQAAENNLTSGMMNRYRDIMANASTNIRNLATGTFVSLATIEFVYTVGMKALGGGDPGDVMRSFIKRMLFIGFWWWMFRNAPALIDNIMATMVDFAQTPTAPVANAPINAPVVASGDNPMNPDNIIDLGIQVMIDTIDNLPGGIREIPTKLAMLLAAACIFLSMLVIAAHMALALLEIYIVGFGSVFLLALGPNRHTTGYAQAYLRYLMSVGVKVFAIALIAALAEVIMRDQVMQMVDHNAGQIWATVGMSGILMILASKAPASISGAIAGISQSSSSVSAGSLIKGAAAAGATAAGVGAAAAAATSAGASAGSVASQASGGGMAGAARGLATGVMSGGGALGKAALQEAGEAIGGRSGSSPYPRGGTAGGRMASRIKKNSKSN